MKTELAKKTTKQNNFQCLRYNSSSIHNMFITRLPGKGQISKEVLQKTLFMETSNK